MRKRKQGEISVYLPKNLSDIVENMAEKLLISKSAVIRLMVKEYCLFKKEMTESYKERYNEDLELGKKLRKFETDLTNKEVNEC